MAKDMRAAALILLLLTFFIWLDVLGSENTKVQTIQGLIKMPIKL